VRLGGDDMPLVEVRRIAGFTKAHAGNQLLHFARGFEQFGQARRAYLADRQLEAADLMRRAASSFTQVASPCPVGADLSSIRLRNDGKLDEAISCWRRWQQQPAGPSFTPERLGSRRRAQCPRPIRPGAGATGRAWWPTRPSGGRQHCRPKRWWPGRVGPRVTAAGNTC
jgi:hypothetical protein